MDINQHSQNITLPDEVYLGIYSSITDTNNWRSTLDELTNILGARSNNIFVVDHVTGELNQHFCSQIVEELMPSYVVGPYVETEVNAITRFPDCVHTTGFLEINDLVDLVNKHCHDQTFDLGPVSKWLRENWGIHHRFCSRLNVKPSYVDVLTLSFGESSELQRKEQVYRASGLLPHLGKAIELSRPFSLLKARFQATLDVLDHFRLGVFMLDQNGVIAIKNESARRILDLKDGVAVDSIGRLKSKATEDGADIKTSAEQLISREHLGLNTSAADIIIPRDSGATAYLAQISLVREKEITNKFLGLMVIIIDPDHTEIVNTNGMKTLFGLTKAESHICQLIVDGCGTNDIAEARNTSIETVRHQIKSVLEKTGGKNRIDIVKTALAINLPVDNPVDDTQDSAD